MGALSAEELPVALARRGGADRLDRGVRRRGAAPTPTEPVRIHVKFDTGMGRLGTRSLSEALAVADSVIAAGPQLQLAGAMTHFATADGDPEFMAAQLAAFAPFAEADAAPGARRSWSTPPTAPRPSATRRPTSTWSGAGSRSTVVTR